MLDKYKIDPAFNKNLVLACQAPPVINTANLPSLPTNWLDDLQKIICTANATLPSHCLNTHLDDASNYHSKNLLSEQLKLIYHRLQGNLDDELDSLLPDNRYALLCKLTEEISSCTEGFHNRVNIIVDSFHKPRNLIELLYIVRKRLVEDVAAELTNEVHTWNAISVIAATDGLGIKANFPDDIYSGALSETTIRRALQEIFIKQFTPYQLPCLLITVFMELIPELAIEKNAENGISLQTQKKIIWLIKRFLPEYINETPNDPNNWKNYFRILRSEKNPLIFSFVNVNWEKMYQSFYYALISNNYFITPPQITTLLDNAYFNLFINKKNFISFEPIICKLFKEKQLADLLTQLIEVKTRFPIFYEEKLSKSKEFVKNCLIFNDFLTKKLKISEEYSEEIIQGFYLILHLDLRRKTFVITKISESFLVKNQAGFNLLMLGALNNLELVKAILAFLKTHESIISPDIAEKMLLMKNSDHCNALMIAAHRQSEAITTILGFLSTHIGCFANDTLYKLFTQQQKKDSYTAVTLTARDHPDLLKSILTFITKHLTIDGETLRKLLFTENSNGACTALMIALKNQSDTSFSILEFIFENSKNFDPEMLRKMFLEKDQNGYTILMLAVRYHPKVFPILLELLNECKTLFPEEFITPLFLEKNSQDANFLMLAVEYQPETVAIILEFIHQKRKFFNSYLVNLLFDKNDKGYNSLMLSRHHPEVMMSLINFICNQPNAVLSLTLDKIFLEKSNAGLTFLMLLAKDKPQSLKLIFEFIDKNPELFTKEKILRLIQEKSIQEYNCLMLAARNHYDATGFILNFIENNPKIFSAEFINQLITTHDGNRNNPLMIAATHQTNVVALLLTFLTNNVAPKGPIRIDTLKKCVFDKVHDKEAANSVFFGGRYGYYKSVLSVTSQLTDPTAVNALLKFIDYHIDSLGVDVYIDLLTEKDYQGNYIFSSACSKYPFPMKKVLNFLADSATNEVLIPIEELSAYFIFKQFARWSLETAEDHMLLDKVIIKCSALLLIYFNKDFFAEKSTNLKLVTDKLFSCYLNELKIQKIHKKNYTTKFSFFKRRYSTSQKLEAVHALEKVLHSDDINKEQALMKLKYQYPAIAICRLGNLFAAYQEIDRLQNYNVSEFSKENDAIHGKTNLAA